MSASTEWFLIVVKLLLKDAASPSARDAEDMMFFMAGKTNEANTRGIEKRKLAYQ